MKLIHKDTRKVVEVGELISDFRGEPAIITGWREPEEQGKSGYVYVKDPNDHQGLRNVHSYYPKVFGLEFVEDDDVQP